MCEECLPGYYHWDCSRKCQYPYYGKACKEDCLCPKNLCNFSYGCTLFEGQRTVVSTQNFKTKNDNFSSIHHSVNIFFTITLPYKRNTLNEEKYQIKWNSSTQMTTEGKAEAFLSSNIIVIMTCLAVLFVLLFAIFVVLNVYKMFIKKRAVIRSAEKSTLKENKNYSSIGQKKDIEERTISLGIQSENTCDDTCTSYLSPLSLATSQYEEIDLHDIRRESKYIPFEHTSEEQQDAYLTPTAVSDGLYIEIIG
ncbi:uncharacterized protein LOC134281251 [Saccostrea cucullata]|uniref:uncharacterized protein LOC134281251 n=1 Tax=Saccostrea cuccullata TaxID=36930 RepID=UPI002ED23134